MLARDPRLLKLVQGRDVAAPERCVTLLLNAHTFLIPVTLKDGPAVEEFAETRVIELHFFIGALRHDMEEGLQGRTRSLDAAVLEIVQRYETLRFHNGIYAGGE